jgi:hypothetical protein
MNDRQNAIETAKAGLRSVLRQLEEALGVRDAYPVTVRIAGAMDACDLLYRDEAERRPDTAE